MRTHGGEAGIKGGAAQGDEMESGDGRRGQTLHTAAAPALRAVAAVALRATHFETENSAFFKTPF